MKIVQMIFPARLPMLVLLLFLVPAATQNCMRLNHSAAGIKQPVSLHRTAQREKTAVVRKATQYYVLFGLLPIGENATEEALKAILEKDNYRSVNKVKALQKVQITSEMDTIDVLISTIGFFGILFSSHTVYVQAEVIAE